MSKGLRKRQMILTFLMIAGISALPSVSAKAQLPGGVGANTISSSGDAEVRVAPDEVILTLGVETSDKVLKMAKSLNDERVQRALAAAKAAGTPPQHIQTDFVSIHPEYQDYRATSQLIGYVVRKTIVIRLKEIAKFESLLTDVLEAGITHVQGIEFRTTELRKYRDQARALAIKAAAEKAEALAKEVNRKAGKALSIGEASYGYWSGYNSGWGNRWGQMSAQNAVQNFGGSSMPSDESSIAPGQITIRATVSATFVLE